MEAPQPDAILSGFANGDANAHRLASFTSRRPARSSAQGLLKALYRIRGNASEPINMRLYGEPLEPAMMRV
jgi:hypothetical protein